MHSDCDTQVINVHHFDIWSFISAGTRVYWPKAYKAQEINQDLTKDIN